MKTSERHQLKHNEVTDGLQQFYAEVEQHRKVVLGTLVALIAIAAAYGSYSFFSNQRASKAGAMLADALVVTEAPVAPPAAAANPDGTAATAPPPTPGSYPSEKAKLDAALPKFLAAADAYPGAQAGIAARYHAASTLATLGRDGEARQQYQRLVDQDGRGLYGRMARLGIAQLDIKTKQYDAAITSLQQLSLDVKGDLPVDAVLIQLGQAYLAAGKKTEAQQAFQRVATEFATSPYASDARKQLDGLKAGA